jgi:hypothetical protein
VVAEAYKTATALAPTLTPAPTATPNTDIWRNCQSQNPNINKVVYEIFAFGTSACKFLQESPDGKYVAYAMLDSMGREILLLETDGVARQIDWIQYALNRGCSKCTMRDLQWGLNNTMIIYITATTSGDPFTSVIDLNGLEIAYLRGHFGEWNSTHAAFYTFQESDWIGGKFSVYDYTTGKSFNLDGINGVKVAGWTENKIYLTVQPYVESGVNYCNLPAYAAMIEINSDGPKFSIIQKSDNSDLSIDINGNIGESQYNRECSEPMG